MTNKILIDEAVVRQALEALELHAKQYPHMQKGYTVDAITALRQALSDSVEQPRSEAALAPAKVFGFEIVVDKTMPPDELRLVRSPPAPAPVPEAHKPLTDEQLHAVIRSGEYDSFEEFARAIEAAVLAKNSIKENA